MIELHAASLADTHDIAAALAGIARSGDLVVLSGEMGAGKTAFAQGFGRALGVDEPITSPTFTLVHSYDADGLTLYHADLYRLERLAEVSELALGELREMDGIVLVEWGEVAASMFGELLEVRLSMVEDDPEAREIELSATGPSWAVRWDAVARVVEAWRTGC